MTPSEPSTPLGIEIVAVWAVITGIALSVIGVARTPSYLPLGVVTLVAAYGLWNLETRGLVLAGIIVAVVAVRNALNGEFVGLGVVLLVLGYLYTQRWHFRRPPVPSLSRILDRSG